ncbi:MAG: hypothetical protein LBU77_01260 [Clostridiales bacterium]|jgi:YbbR domain-containing protein|nr:hypothetical protein [Clostridiales bacterium]
MISGLKGLILKDLKWKICALGFSVALWLYCMNVTGATIKTDTISLRLTIDNEASLASENLVLENKAELESRYILLQIRGKREDVERLKRDTAKIKAYIDLAPIELHNSQKLGERQSTGVYVEKSGEFSGVEVINKTPPTVGITLDRYEKITRDIKVITSGNPSDNYSAGKTSANPETVEIWGARSTLAKIDYVGVNVDINGKTEDVTLSTAPIAYDVDNNIVAGDIKILPETADVSVSINKWGQMPIVRPTYTGGPPDGYVITAVEWEPKYAEVVGSEEAINTMQPIVLTPEDVSGFTMDKAVPHDLGDYLSEGLQIRNGTPQEVVVTYQVEQLIEKTFEIPVSALNVRGYTAGAVFTEETVSVTVQAIQSVISAVIPTDLVGTVDLTGLGGGTHTVPVTFALRDGVKIAGITPATEITITAAPTEAPPGEPENTENPPEDGGEASVQ